MGQTITGTDGSNHSRNPWVRQFPEWWVKEVRNIHYWKDVAENPDPDDINSQLGKPINDIPKVIFSNTLKSNKWDNTSIISGDLNEQVKGLKQGSGNEIIVYGGNSFVSSLVQAGLVDEYYLLVNPLAISGDEPVLKFINDSVPLRLKDCKPFGCGTVLLTYL